jgi:phage tail-like protein
MANAEKYPLPAFHFKVTFDGLPGSETAIDSQFSEVSGLMAEITTEELQEGGENRFVHKLPVKAKFPNLVLKRALFPVSSSLMDWAKNAIYNFDISPCSVLVSLLNEKHEPARSWNFKSVYPVKIQISDFKATDNAVVIETLELAYDYAREVTQ